MYFIDNASYRNMIALRSAAFTEVSYLFFFFAFFFGANHLLFVAPIIAGYNIKGNKRCLVD